MTHLATPTLDRRQLFLGAAAFTALSAAWGRVHAAVSAGGASARVADLIARMTLEEKAGQLTLMPDVSRAGALAGANPAQVAARDELIEGIRTGRIGGVFNGVGAAGARELQRLAVNETRLGVPLIFGADIIHGFRVIFPIPLGESASFDADLARRTARAAAEEASAAGLHWTFAPMVDIARDQRWGRVAEGAGEDPYLGAILAAARVRGFQGRNLRDHDSLLACAKHFAAYGAVEGGRDYATADIPETTLRDLHLPPFKAAFDAGALTVMSAFNDIAGVPATANRHLLTEILREEWGFGGFVVSDYTSDEELILHGFAADGADATRLALTAGLDMSMTSQFFIRFAPDLVRAGAVEEAQLDEAVRRVLSVKETIGLFDNPYRSLDPTRERRVVRNNGARRALSREAGRRSIVLLKNENELLPLSRSGQRIALVGPFGADIDNVHGTWAFLGDRNLAVSLEAGLRAAMRDPSLLSVVQGSGVTAPIEGGIDAAVAAAQAADVVVLAIGETQNMSGEAQSRVDIVVPQAQQALAEAVAATGKPVVVLLRHGRALALHGAVRNAQAILACWFLGTETGHAVADVLFGAHAPSARLPVSFPQESGQQPFYYNRRSGGRPQLTDDAAYKARYREVTDAALYPFGHGLTYTRFAYGPVELSSDTLAWDGSITISARITNNGERAGEEVAQLYIHDRVASVTRPMRELKGFQRVRLEPGASATVSFTLTREELAFHGVDLARRAEPGQFDVWIAPSAEAGEPARFTLTA